MNFFRKLIGPRVPEQAQPEPERKPRYEVLIPALEVHVAELEQFSIRPGDECFLDSALRNSGFARCQLIESHPEPREMGGVYFTVKLKILEIIEVGEDVKEGSTGTEITLSKNVPIDEYESLKEGQRTGRKTRDWVRSYPPWVLYKPEMVKKLE